MVVAPAFHSLRALITTVSEVERQRASIAVYSMPGASEAWTQVVTHNQGTVRDSRVGQRAPRAGKRPRLSPQIFLGMSCCRAARQRARSHPELHSKGRPRPGGASTEVPHASRRRRGPPKPNASCVRTQIEHTVMLTYRVIRGERRRGSCNPEFISVSRSRRRPDRYTTPQQTVGMYCKPEPDPGLIVYVCPHCVQNTHAHPHEHT